MRRWRSAALGAALAAAAFSADAQISTQSNGPMDISADNGTFVNSECESTWSGSAEVLQGTTRLRAATIRAFFRKKPAGPGGAAAQGVSASGGLPGGPQSNCGATERIEAEGDVFYVTPDQVARGDHAVYTADNDQIVMTGNVIVVQGKNVIHGDRLTIHVADKQAQMQSAAQGRGAPNRVRGVFYSNQPGGPGAGLALQPPR